jgi:hypothetical protein
MDLVQFLAVQMYKQSTTQLRQTASRSRMDTKFPSVSVEPATEFEMVPADSDGSGDYLRVVLVGSKTAPLNRGFQIVGQAVIGRDDGESTVDIDLTDFGPEVRGVSRRHAEFKVRDGQPRWPMAVSSRLVHSTYRCRSSIDLPDDKWIKKLGNLPSFFLFSGIISLVLRQSPQVGSLERIF